jgi:hypothetical protein
MEKCDTYSESDISWRKATILAQLQLLKVQDVINSNRLDGASFKNVGIIYQRGQT